MDRVEAVPGPDEGATTPGAEGASDQPRAWEQIAEGRYMPRRIRGSCPGRELG